LFCGTAWSEIGFNKSGVQLLHRNKEIEMKKQKKKVPVVRNYLVVIVVTKSGAGKHKDKKRDSKAKHAE
jgi:hypothetical protein